MVWPMLAIVFDCLGTDNLLKNQRDRPEDKTNEMMNFPMLGVQC